MKKQLPVSRSTRNSTIAGPSHSRARSNFNDASASAGSRVSAIAITATPPVAGASFNRRCWNAAAHSPLCSSISTPTPTPGQYSCSKTGPGSFIRSASDNISRVGKQRTRKTCAPFCPGLATTGKRSCAATCSSSVTFARVQVNGTLIPHFCAASRVRALFSTCSTMAVGGQPTCRSGESWS